MTDCRGRRSRVRKGSHEKNHKAAQAADRLSNPFQGQERITTVILNSKTSSNKSRSVQSTRNGDLLQFQGRASGRPAFKSISRTRKDHDSNPKIQNIIQQQAEACKARETASSTSWTGKDQELNLKFINTSLKDDILRTTRFKTRSIEPYSASISFFSFGLMLRQAGQGVQRKKQSCLSY